MRIDAKEATKNWRTRKLALAQAEMRGTTSGCACRATADALFHSLRVAAVVAVAMGTGVCDIAAAASYTETVAGGLAASGYAKSFSQEYVLLSGSTPAGFHIANVRVDMHGDRRCGAWAICRTEVRGDRVAMVYQLQGHDENEWRVPGGGGNVAIYTLNDRPQRNSQALMYVTYESDPLSEAEEKIQVAWANANFSGCIESTRVVRERAIAIVTEPAMQIGGTVAHYIALAHRGSFVARDVTWVRRREEGEET